jgi:hypothetical protein
MSHIKQDDPDGTTVTRRGTGAHQRFPEQPPTSAANDNDCEGPWPLIPFPEGLNGTPSGQQIRRLSTESARPLNEEVTIRRAVQAGFRSSWRATLARLAYAVAVSIAMFGWLYVLWLALVSSVQWILS